MKPELLRLLDRLGPDFREKGRTDGPMPLVTLEEFYEGNDDWSSPQAGVFDLVWRGLEQIRDRDDVSDVRLGITAWEGVGLPEDTPRLPWPYAEYIYVVTRARVADVRRWFREADIHVDQIGSRTPHREAEALDVPEGHKIVWGWID